ncbi:MAG: hypothetical protein CMH47_06265 [Muricauda sp.]|nr:hypothetical protein [Allomuricauda sp.]|tara:strand:- start:26 stop:466 length:441 start_codon:yes stop_codon:yes gene_type:complete
MNYSRSLGKKLNNLLEKIYISENEFERAGKLADSPSLKNFFLEKAKERCHFGHELKIEMMKFNQEIRENVGSAGTLQQGWMDFSIHRNEPMFGGAIEAEGATLDSYRMVLQEIDLPSSVEVIIRQQMNKISNDLNIIKRLGKIAQS